MTHSILHADCLAALSAMPTASVDLIYLDPPFNTNLKRQTATAHYADAFGAPRDYIAYMRPRVEQMCRVLTPNGSLFFHCDWRTGHHVRVMLDEMFAPHGRFINEIIWHYGLGASRAGRQLLTKHDVIFWYANGPDYVFNLIRDAPTAAMLNKYRHIDEEGRRYMMSYGRRYTLKGGKPLDDVWDIPAIAPTSGERAGYPTQKPLTLLRRILQLASHEGQTVLDPFCGSGTTLVAAQQLGRHGIGIDANVQAVDIARRRLGLDSGPASREITNV